MIMDLLIIESEKNLKEQQKLKQKIDTLPNGTLKKRMFHGNVYYYLAYRENHKVVNKYIKDKEKVAEQIKTRKVYEKKLQQLESDWDVFNKVGILQNSLELRQVINESALGQDFGLAFRGFLDAFYSFKADKEKMHSLIRHEPVQYESVPNYQYSMCAAAAHKLANDYGVEVPSWVWKKRYYLTDMYFGGVGKTRLRMYNMLYSPPEFKHRNLFIDENILARV